MTNCGEKYNEAAIANPDVVERRAKSEALLSAPVRVSLNEVPIRPESGPGGRFIQRVLSFVRNLRHDGNLIRLFWYLPGWVSVRLKCFRSQPCCELQGQSIKGG